MVTCISEALLSALFWGPDAVYIVTKWLLVRQEARTQSGRRQLGSVTLARSRVRVRAGYEFVSCRHHPDQRLPAGPIATAI